MLENFSFSDILSWPLSPLSCWRRFTVVLLHGLMEDLVTAVIAEVFITNVRQHWKWSVITLLPFHCDSSIIGHVLSRVNLPYFHLVTRRDTFMVLSVYNAVYNGLSICEYKVYWHMSFSLINGCGTHKNYNHGHSFCWSDTCEFTNIPKKVNKQVY